MKLLRSVKCVRFRMVRLSPAAWQNVFCHCQCFLSSLMKRSSEFVTRLCRTRESPWRASRSSYVVFRALNRSLSYADHQDTILPASPAKWWMFWLPLVFVWLALYMVEHSTYYASADFAKLGDGNKVSESVSGGSATRQVSMVLLGAMGVGLLLLPAGENLVPNRGMLFLIFAALFNVVDKRIVGG